MFSAIRRVISDSEDVGKSHKKAKTEMDSPERQQHEGEGAATPMEGVVHQQTTAQSYAASPDSHLVEPDNDSNIGHHALSTAPLKMVQPQSQNYASNSSLSDSSDSLFSILS